MQVDQKAHIEHVLSVTNAAQLRDDRIQRSWKRCIETDLDPTRPTPAHIIEASLFPRTS